MSFLQEKDQRIYMFPEQNTAKKTDDYQTPLNGTQNTANPATYPWYKRINLITEGLSYDIPIQLKEKLRDIGAGNHASHVVNTTQDPVDITFETKMVDATFLAMAIGTCATAADVLAAECITQFPSLDD